MADGRPTLRKMYRNVWCILRSIDRDEVLFSDPSLSEQWKTVQWH